MKKFALLAAISLVFISSVNAQVKDYKVVFDMTSKDTLNQQALIRQLTLISQSNTSARLEVVVYGQGLDLVVKDKSAENANLQQLLLDKNISVKVCGMTLKRNKIDKTQLVTGVQVVSDGIYEIIKRQSEGWGYIKVGR